MFVNRYKEAQEVFDSVTTLLQVEISVRFNNAKSDAQAGIDYMKQIRKTVI